MIEAKMLKILIVDDHPLMGAGISGEVNAQPDMRVVAEASDGDEAITLFQKHRPDVTLMDIRMPKTNGIDAITRIRQLCPVARIMCSRPTEEMCKR